MTIHCDENSTVLSEEQNCKVQSPGNKEGMKKNIHVLTNNCFQNCKSGPTFSAGKLRKCPGKLLILHHLSSVCRTRRQQSYSVQSHSWDWRKIFWDKNSQNGYFRWSGIRLFSLYILSSLLPTFPVMCSLGERKIKQDCSLIPILFLWLREVQKKKNDR